MTKGFVHETTVGKTVEWYTPKWIFDGLGITFDMDVASPETGPVPWIPAKRFITPSEDAFSVPWEGKVCLNPPYDRNLNAWVEKFIEHNNGIMLVFGRTDAKWAQKLLTFVHHNNRRSTVCFIKGRVKFVNSEGDSSGTPGTGSMLIGLNGENQDALFRFQEKGLGVCLW